MAVEVGTAYLTVLPSAKGFSRALDSQVGGGMKDSGDKAGKRFGGGMVAAAGKFAGPLAAAFAGVKLVGVFKDAIEGASDLNEAGTKTEAIFGKKGAKALDEFTKGSAKKLGQTKLQILDAAGTFGTFGKAAGLGGKDLVKFSTGFSTLSTDMASFFNTSPEEAMQAIASGLRGEAEPLRKYGVLLDDASLRQEALKQGLIKTTKQALTPQQKVLAAQALIYKQTKDAQGDFARTSGGLANQQRILSAQWSEAKSKLGTVLLPVVNKVITAFNRYFQPAVDAVGRAFKRVAPFLTAASGAISGLFGLIANGNTDKLANAFGWAEDSAIVTNLAGLRDGVAGIFSAARDGGGALDSLRSFFVDQLGPAVRGVAGAIGGLVRVLAPIVRQVVGTLVENFGKVGPYITSVFESVKSVVLDVLTIIKAQVRLVTLVISAIWSRFGPTILLIVGNVFRGLWKIIAGVMKVIAGIVKTILGLMTGDWKKAGEGLKKIWEGLKLLLLGIWTAILKNILIITARLTSGIVSKFKEFLGWAGSKLKSGLAAIKDFILTPIRSARDALRTLMDRIAGIFSSGVTAMGKAWAKLESKAKAPVKFVVQTVINDALIGGFNGLADKLGLKLNIPTIKLPKGFSSGGYTGAGGKYDPRGIVHAGEVVFDQDAVAAAGGPHRLDAFRLALRRGTARLQGFAKGGIVWPTNTRRLSANYPGHSGVDIAAGQGAPIYAATSGQISYTGWGRGYGQAIFERAANGLQMVYGHTSKLIARVGQIVRAGQLIGRVGATGRAFGPHLHFEVAPNGRFALPSNRAATLRYLGGSDINSTPGSGDGGPAFDFLGALRGKFSGALGKLKGLGSSPFAQIVKRFPVMVRDALLDKAKGLVGDTVGKVAGGAKAAAWTPVLLTALKMNGLPVSLLDNWIRQVQSESGGNPNAVQQITDINSRNGNLARGLLQVIPPTFAAYRSRALPNNIFNPLANAYAAMNYARHRYRNLEAVIGHGHGYARGTRSAAPGVRWVGERGPELVDFRGGERVYTATASERMADSSRGDRTLIVNGDVYGDDFERRIFDEWDSRERRAAVRANFTALPGVPG